MKIGYARVSTDEQNLDLQRHALQAAGCEAIYEDQGISGAENARPGLAQALGRIAAGDVLVVWKLDRLGRSLSGHGKDSVHTFTQGLPPRSAVTAVAGAAARRAAAGAVC